MQTFRWRIFPTLLQSWFITIKMNISPWVNFISAMIPLPPLSKWWRRTGSLIRTFLWNSKQPKLQLQRTKMEGESQSIPAVCSQDLTLWFPQLVKKYKKQSLDQLDFRMYFYLDSLWSIANNHLVLLGQTPLVLSEQQRTTGNGTYRHPYGIIEILKWFWTIHIHTVVQAGNQDSCWDMGCWWDAQLPKHSCIF